MKYGHIVQAICGTSWAIEESKLLAIIEFVQMKVNGLSLTPDQVEALTKNTPKPEASIRASHGRDLDGNRIIGGKKIAVLPIHGTISPRMTLMGSISGGTSAEGISREFASLVDDPDIGTIVLDIDSPGGAVSGIEELANQVFEARDQVRIVAHANSLAASAAFWIGSQAHEFVATPSGEVGSIGVIAVHEAVFRAKEAEGRDITVIKAGKFKQDNSPLEPLSDEAKAAIQGRVDERFDTFISAVSRGRNVSNSTVINDFGEGRVVGAKTALSSGMIDAVETLDETIARLIDTPVASNQNAGPASNEEVTNVAFEISSIEDESLRANVQSVVDDLQEQLEAARAENTVDDPESQGVSPEVMATLPQEVKDMLAADRAAVEEAQAKAEAAEAIAAEEREHRIQRELKDEAGKMFASLPGTADEKANMLGAIRNLSAEQQEVVIKNLKAGDTAIRTLLTTEVGRHTTEPGSALAKIETLAAEMVESEGITKAQAIRKLSRSKEHRELYGQYVSETRKAVRQ